MARMELACFMVIAFMAVMYFSTKREKSGLHRVFSIFLLLSMLHLVLDGISVWTVNHLQEVPGIVNDVVHRLFIGTMVALFYLVYRYIVLMIGEEIREKLQASQFSFYMLLAALIGICFLPIRYREMAQGNYSYGPAAYMTYVCVAIYLIMIIVTMLRYWKGIHKKKKMVITLAMGIEVVVSVYQALNPTALLSGMAIMLLNLSFYLLMENPDIALAMEVQKEKEKADRANAYKSTFLSNMSHEIRTPMNAIVGMTDILLRTELSEEQKDYLLNIKNSGNALVSIINDILDISKIEAGKMELVEGVYDIKKELSDIKMIIENRIGEKPITLCYEIDETLPSRLYGDAVRIRQVIINLLNNAVKFTDEGMITLSVRVERIVEKDVRIRVSVMDTGQGIREEDFTKLFEAFEQVDQEKNAGKEGTGLGLSISNRLIGLMGGKLQVKSTYGEGSEFFFTIYQKLAWDMEPEQETVIENYDFTAPDARILLVDDNEMNRKVGLGLLKPFEMQIDVAVDGKKALEMIGGKEYDLILMDHMMPVLDGVEATKRLRQMQGNRYQTVPVIALTANAMKETEKLFFDAGMNDVLTKPIDMGQMCRVLKKWLPEELLVKNSVAILNEAKIKAIIEPSEEFSLPGIDVNEGIKNSGNREMFLELLGAFYTVIDSKAGKIRECVANDRIRDYTIEVHALKSSARLIGAMELSKEFERLEEFGNAGDVDSIHERTEDVLKWYESYKAVLKPYGERTQEEKRTVDEKEIIDCLRSIQEGTEQFDLDATDAAMEELETMRLPDNCLDLMNELRVFIADVAMEDILKTIERIVERMNEDTTE